MSALATQRRHVAVQIEPNDVVCTNELALASISVVGFDCTVMMIRAFGGL